METGCYHQLEPAWKGISSISLTGVSLLINRRNICSFSLVVCINTVMWEKEKKMQIPPAKFRFKPKWARKTVEYHNFTDAFLCRENIFLWLLHSYVMSHPTCQLMFLQLKHFTLIVYSAFHPRISSYFANTNYTFQPSMKCNFSPKSWICQ